MTSFSKTNARGELELICETITRMASWTHARMEVRGGYNVVMLDMPAQYRFIMFRHPITGWYTGIASTKGKDEPLVLPAHANRLDIANDEDDIVTVISGAFMAAYFDALMWLAQSSGLSADVRDALTCLRDLHYAMGSPKLQP